MRNFKKLLSLVLCMAVMLSVMVVGAGAAFSDQKEIKNTEAVDMCVALNIINGYTDGSYKPEGNVTRAEMCKMICIALNGGKEPATATKATPTYTDIKGHWAEGYIEYCNTKGIVAGVGGGKFNPAGNVTGSQAAKMLLVALGYNADVERYTGESWELYVNVQANQDGLYTDLESMDPSVALTRDNAAQMIWNALQAYVINKTSSIDREDGSITDMYSKDPSTDLLAKMYKGKTQEGTLGSFTYNANDKDWDYTVNFTTSAGPSNITVNSDVDYTALLGQKVKAVYDNSTSGATKDAYGIFAVDSQVILTGVVGDLPSITAGSVATSFKVDGTTYKTDDAINATEVYVFTENMDAFAVGAGMLDDLASVNTYDSQKFEAIDKDGDGKIDFFMIYPVAVAKVSSVSSSTVKLTDKKDPMGVLTGITSVDVDDATIYTGIAKGDYVAYTAAANTADATEVLVKADLISGKITKLSGRDATINGTVYTFDALYGTVPGVGTVMTDSVVVNGYVFSADATASADATDYVVVVSSVASEYGTYRVKLLFSDGTKKVVDLDGNQSLTTGCLYTYETNSDDEYTLNVVPGSGTLGGSVSQKSNSSSKVAYINGNSVLDDSVIFVKYGSGSYKAITGATLKTMSVSQFNTDGGVYYVNASSNASTGVGDVNFAYIATNSTVTSISSNDEFYGYITDISETKNVDNKTVKEITMWTKDGEIVLKTKANLSIAPSVQENTVVIYKLNSDGDIDSITTSGVQTGAVTAITEAFMTIGGANKYFDDDVIVVTIDTSEVEGVAKDCNYSDIGTADGGVANVYYVMDSGEVVFVAYDIDNVIS